MKKSNPLKFFIDSISKKYFKINSRSSRKEYIYFILFYGITSFLLKILYSVTLLEFIKYIIQIFGIILFIPSVTLTIRRLHDLNFSGYFNLLIIPIILLIKNNQYTNIGIILGLLAGLILVCIKGTSGNNKYGSAPEYNTETK